MNKEGDNGGPARRVSGQTVFLAAAVVISCLMLALVAFSTGRAPKGNAEAAARPSEAEAAPPVYGYEVLHTYPHDPKAFCQGLVFEDGVLYEGTGQYGRSTLRKVDLTTGRVLQVRRLGPALFGEGITAYNDEIIQLTWKRGLGFVFERQSFRQRRSFRYAGEGWGLTYDGQQLIISDGSAVLRFLDPKTFRVVRKLTVRSRGTPLSRLNELEYVEGEIFANVWGTDFIARISPDTGKVSGWIDLRGLLKPHERHSQEAVLNGIAFDRKQGRLFVTGKYWPKLVEIRLVPKS